MTRPRGRATRGERLLASVPHGHWETTTFLAAIRSTGLTALLVVDGAINNEISLGWVRHHLVPTLQSGDVVVMDNLGVHKVAGVREAIAAAGVRVVYLPPYSPDLNPIKIVFSKFEWFLKSASARTVEALWSVCGDVLDRFTEAEQPAGELSTELVFDVARNGPPQRSSARTRIVGITPAAVGRPRTSPRPMPSRSAWCRSRASWPCLPQGRLAVRGRFAVAADASRVEHNRGRRPISRASGGPDCVAALHNQLPSPEDHHGTFVEKRGPGRHPKSPPLARGDARLHRQRLGQAARAPAPPPSAT